MALLLHITIAILSIIMSGAAALLPSKTKLTISYGLVAGTLASGTYLVMSTGSALLQACVTGLVYLGVVFAILILAKHRLLAAERSRNE